MKTDSALTLFTSADGQVRLQLKLEDETLWLTQRQIAELFEKSPKTISEHITNIYDDGELVPEVTIRPYAYKKRTVALEGLKMLAPTLRKFRIVAREGLLGVKSVLGCSNLDAAQAQNSRLG